MSKTGTWYKAMNGNIVNLRQVKQLFRGGRVSNTIIAQLGDSHDRVTLVKCADDAETNEEMKRIAEIAGGIIAPLTAEKVHVDKPLSKSEKIEKAVFMKSEGFTIDFIAKTLGVKEFTVEKYLKESQPDQQQPEPEPHDAKLDEEIEIHETQQLFDDTPPAEPAVTGEDTLDVEFAEE